MQTTSRITRVDLDPRDLLVDVTTRTDAHLAKDFIASIKDFGVLGRSPPYGRHRQRGCALRPPTHARSHRG
jgi:hypothetical protein